VWRHFAALYEIFPLFHPNFIANLYDVAFIHPIQGHAYHLGMVDAISSLIALYAGKRKETFQLFYDSALHRLRGFRSASIEAFICQTILVSDPNPCNI